MDLKDKKILVTGGSGFLGTHVLAVLSSHGVPKKNISAPTSKERNLLLKAECERVVAGVDVVIHLAGLTGNGKFHNDHPGEIFYGNMMMGFQLMDAARRAGVKKFVTAGSAAEYPAHASSPLEEKVLWDGLPEKTHMPYAIAKSAFLAQGQAYRDEYRFDAIHLILTNMYGPFAKSGSGAIPVFIEKIFDAKRNNESKIVFGGTGEATRDFLYAEDAAEAIVLATERYSGREPVNIGSGGGVSIKEVARVIAKLADFRGTLEFEPSKFDDNTKRILDVSHAEKEFGFRATTPLEIGLQKTIEWYNAQI
jgi:GDP-L-fucose synthase